uniref:50S ribosomal protein L12, chloroplastic n=1 Tax=Choreocolax polysiphoniae TaxID=282351 RepID=A0A0B5VQF4_9FLOR|nr:50S ribosomal protein L12 [Choreocolax polysiphoniae]AJH65842.1 50S ribosomal protein L12 [Choreocolax polysiphoniae]
MNNKINKIIEELKSLTLLEATDLVKQIEKIFFIDTSTSINTKMIMIPTNSKNTLNKKVEEKTKFDVILEEVPVSKKIPILKVIRSLISLGLKEAKVLVESIPQVIKTNISKNDAEVIKIKLEEVGAKVLIK